MRSVSEVVWAAAHGKGMPVPYRACKLTRYLQDTLCPSGNITCCPKQLPGMHCAISTLFLDSPHLISGTVLYLASSAL